MAQKRQLGVQIRKAQSNMEGWSSFLRDNTRFAGTVSESTASEIRPAKVGRAGTTSETGSARTESSRKAKK